MIKSGTVQNDAELGAPGDEYNKSPYREGRPRLLKDKTHRPTTPSGIFSRLFNHLGAHAWMAFGKECIPEGVVGWAWRVYLATGFDFREKHCVFLGSIGGRICFQSPTLPLYYEGKVMKTTFPKNYVYVLRTTETRHMVSFTDFYFHFPANFQT